MTEQHLAGKLGSRKPIPTVILSTAKDLGGGVASGAPPLPGNLAYVLYTSGSTGRPKAVAVEHRSAAALVAWAGEVFAPGELDGVLASTSVAFDLSVFELFLTLSRGGKVVLAPDALHLPALPAAGEVTLVNTVPSVLAELLRVTSLPASVRVVNLAGEPLPSHLAEEVYAQPSVERVLNLYGPSEDTTYSTWTEVPRGSDRAPSIGRPVAGTRVYLLDSLLDPVPAGVPGEICLAGAGLARGYLGRPELTAEQFIPDPFGAPGDRLYRTGDLGRYRPDGEIEFLGRRDYQVKVRGFRIELGEIEAALRRHPGVRDAAVVVQEVGEDRRLVACWVPRWEERAPVDGELRSFLQKRLPDAMLPSAFLALPALPLTPNGKVDREALSRLEPAPRRAAQDEGPLTATEEAVAGIWREVLRLPEVGVEESFFTLGGHSLLATRVTSRLREVFGVELPVRTLFEAPTVRELARVVEKEVGVVEPAAPPAIPIPRMPFLLLDRQLRPVPAGVPGEVWLGGVQPGPAGSDRFAPDPTVPGAWLYRTDETAVLRADGTLEILTQRTETGEADVVSPAVPLPREGSPLPLSFAQERLWFLDRLEPGGSRHNMPFALAAYGALEPARLDAVLSEVARRHEALRTTFDEQEGRPVQVVAPPSPVRLPLIDLAALPAALARPAAERLASEEARRPFDLRRGPLLRGALLRLSSREEGDEHVLLLDMHHIVTDGWSMGVLVGEVSALYRASLAGEPSPLPELPIQYADFAVWQREQLGEKGMERQLAFWRKQLTGAPAVLDLPADRPRPIVQSFRGGRVELLLGPGAVRGLRRLCELYGATLFMTLLGGGAALLQRLSGQDDLVIGTPIANRNHLATERLIGFFVNSLALRLDLADDPTVGSLLERASDAAFAAYDHQDLPFERLVEELRPERHLSHHPVFQVMLALQNAPGGAVDLPGLTLDTFGFEVLNAQFDLELTFEEVDEALAVTLCYSADLFDAPTAQRLAGQLVTLLEGLAAAEPELRISELPLLTAPERHQLGLEWNDSLKREAPAGTLHGLVEAQAELWPDAVALVDDGEALTCGELIRRAGRLAAALGIEPEERIGLRLPNTFERVIALLAVLQAGGAYVPLDPTYPAERLEFLVRDSGAKIVLDKLPPLPEMPFMPPAVLPDQTAYITYTSGSTGVPNGVVTTHRGAVSFVAQASRLEGLEPGVRMPQIASFGFDASVIDIFLTLANGGVLVRVPEEERLAPEVLAERLVRHEATALSITPALLATLPEPRLRGVRHLYVGGDACPADLPPRWAPGRRFYNCYGPTETTVFALTGLYEGEAGAPPIGRPLGGVRAYAIDREMRQVPIGVPGEMALGGPGLSRGYLGRPALTAERFVPDPFGEPGGRLYRTGDLVRQLPDGRFEFLGRLDGQVKLRGMRIETGEVEAVLASHPEVREAVVTAREDAAGKRLVAYVVRHEDVGEVAETAAEHVEAWRTLYDETNGSGSEFTGWNSSYTGLPIPEEEMREWADAAVARILALRPRRVLEVGCGTGILLRRVAPHVERYHGTDFSRAALDRLRPEADRLGATLEERAADDWSGIEPGSFDLVVLNSVSQYFPGVEYLVRVLRGAARVVAPSGAVFAGDVRSLPLLEDFALSVEQAIAPAGISDDELLHRVFRRVEEEEELVVDPALFHALAESTPAIRGAEVLGKSGRFDNEMTRFRYDVVLHIDGEEGEPEARPWSSWANDPLRVRLARRLVPRLRQSLRERLPEYMVPSAFVVLDALPITPNGKVDRAALPAPDPARTDGAYHEPRDPVEAELAEIWAELLGAERVGVLDNFFDLGGHSLLATQVISRVRDRFGVELPVRALFEEPTVAGLAARAREQKPAVAAADTAPIEPIAPIAPIPRDGSPLPLSFAQERLWFLDLLEPDRSVYNMPFALAARGALEPARLDAVLSEVVRRHESLRTTFDDREGRPIQVIAPPSPVRLPRVDLAALPAALARAEAERLAAEEAQRPFDLRRGPLLRGALLRLSSQGERDEHILLLDMHHIVSDGWSIGVLVSEVSALYRAALAGEPSPLPELPIQYADLAVWQREQLGEAGMERQLAFWRERLAGAPAILDLPTDRPRPVVQSYRGGRFALLLGPGPVQSLRRLGGRYGATLFMTLLGGGAALLQRLTGQDDLVIGTAIANRNHLSAERLIGFFVNSLALRLDLADYPTAGVLVERARDTAFAAYEHQDLPFERLVEELRPERHLSHQPVFQVMLALQNAPLGAVDLPGLTLETFGFETLNAKFDLELTFQELDGALVVTTGYAADLFDASTARRLGGQLVTLLEGLASAKPEQRISGLPLLTEPERHQLALEWNDLPRREAPAETLHGLVEAQAELRPDAVALIDDGEALTYGELLRRAGRLAAALAGLGVGPEVRVGLRLPNSFDRVIALLAVLRAGGAYVPLEPTYPAERLAFMTADSGAKIVLTSLGEIPPLPEAPFTPPA
ncbi:MAG TPA: amino acid adenylation domain-containing protein, partial [Thermoanaerobaculia bacterium]|nr:amino acid adenylation domain-containing protein [Thermoanaerobaculia bacterium]